MINKDTTSTSQSSSNDLDEVGRDDMHCFTKFKAQFGCLLPSSKF